jgi:hypothetical protein
MRNQRIRPRDSIRIALGTALAAVALSGCGNVTVGGYTNVNVAMTGNSTTPAPTVLAASYSRLEAPLQADSAPSGQVELAFRLYLVAESGDTVRLGGGDLEASLDVEGQDEPQVAQALVPAGRYKALEVVFKEVSVEVEGGLVVGGQTITGPVDVEIEGLSLPVTRAVNIDALDGATIQILVDLNAPAWLEAVDPVTKTINQDVFAGLVDVVVQ